jgi:hypothetical protein
MTSRFSPWRNSSGFTCVSFQRVLPSLAQVRACRFCDARLPRGPGLGPTLTPGGEPEIEVGMRLPATGGTILAMERVTSREVAP